MTDTINIINEQVKTAAPWAKSLYHEFHRFPELSNQEYKTADRIESILNGLGIYTERPIPTGITGLIQGTGAGTEGESVKTAAIRADIDALPLMENSGMEFSSETPGIMHACGHDLHIAILLGTARVLMKMKHLFNGNIKLIFQPAEETTGGAEKMIKNGCLKDPEVDQIIGLHVKPDLPTGKIGIGYGGVHAASDGFCISIKGRSAHGAGPDKGIDAIIVSAHVIGVIQTIISRETSPLDAAVISIGTIKGGAAPNIVADEVIMEGTIRSFDTETRRRLKKSLSDKVQLTAKAMGAKAHIDYYRGYDALLNNSKVVDIMKDCAISCVGRDQVEVISKPTMGVDDFAFYLNQCPGAFFFLGCGYENKENPPLHSPRFNGSEECVETGILVETAGVLALLKDKMQKEKSEETHLAF